MHVCLHIIHERWNCFRSFQLSYMTVFVMQGSSIDSNLLLVGVNDTGIACLRNISVHPFITGKQWDSLGSR